MLRKVVLRKVFILKRRYGQEDFATQRGKTERELKVMPREKAALTVQKVQIGGGGGGKFFLLSAHRCGSV